tara:strand:- start:24 stop:539 length:516 start_codon:yes stop_codon:yes gene_type:complete
MIFLSIGSNLKSKWGDRFHNVKLAKDRITDEKINVKKISSFYETPSYPNKNDPKFINIVIEVEFSDDPESLLEKILLIEKKLGRVRNLKNEPRTFDIDIIDFNGLVLLKENISLPHPKMHLRNFVLFPLQEICPTWTHPVLNKKVNVLIENLTSKASNEITRIKESDILNP